MDACAAPACCILIEISPRLHRAFVKPNAAFQHFVRTKITVCVKNAYVGHTAVNILCITDVMGFQVALNMVLRLYIVNFLFSSRTFLTTALPDRAGILFLKAHVFPVWYALLKPSYTALPWPPAIFDLISP